VRVYLCECMCIYVCMRFCVFMCVLCVSVCFVGVCVCVCMSICVYVCTCRYIQSTIYRTVVTFVPTAEHLIHHCSILETQRDVMKHTIQKSGGKWPTSNKEIIAKHLRAFTTFIN